MLPRKKIIRKILICLMLFMMVFCDVVTTEREAEASVTTTIYNAELNIIASLLVAAGMTFVTTDAMYAAAAEFIVIYGAAAAEVTTLAATIGPGGLIVVSAVLATAIYTYVNNVMNPAIANPTQSINYSVNSSTTTNSTKGNYFDINDFGWINDGSTRTQNIVIHFASHPTSGFPATLGSIACSYYQNGTRYVGAGSLLIMTSSNTLVSDFNNYVLPASDVVFNADGSLDVHAVVSTNSNPALYCKTPTNSWAFCNAIGMQVDTTKTNLGVSLVSSNYFISYSHSSSLPGSSLLGANTHIDTVAALHDLTGASLKIVDNTTLLNKSVADMQVTMNTQTGFLSNISADIHALPTTLTNLFVPANTLAIQADFTAVQTAFGNVFPFSFFGDLHDLFYPVDGGLQYPKLGWYQVDPDRVNRYHVYWDFGDSDHIAMSNQLRNILTMGLWLGFAVGLLQLALRRGAKPF